MFVTVTNAKSRLKNVNGSFGNTGATILLSMAITAHRQTTAQYRVKFATHIGEQKQIMFTPYDHTRHTIVVNKDSTK